ncbi:hypothetical protein AMECASPLE_018581 [Ameca splendens]|uniref:Uncharacterized protein n=1 Tax=Ameca splendens TaxID=208324 RepID=A0ABV0ZNY0_9TELE
MNCRFVLFDHSKHSFGCKDCREISFGMLYAHLERPSLSLWQFTMPVRSALLLSLYHDFQLGDTPRSSAPLLHPIYHSREEPCQSISGATLSTTINQANPVSVKLDVG